MEAAHGACVVKRVRKTEIVYCAQCGKATTPLEASLRRFRTGLSGCCAENLIAEQPLLPVHPLGALAPDPPWVAKPFPLDNLARDESTS
jgi:hypothetical protein